MTIEKDEAYRLPSGRCITVKDVEGGMVTYVIDGLKSLVPLRAPIVEFARMVGNSPQVA